MADQNLVTTIIFHFYLTNFPLSLKILQLLDKISSIIRFEIFPQKHGSLALSIKICKKIY